MLLCVVYLLHNIGSVFIGAVSHFRIKVGKVLSWIVGISSEKFLDLVFTEGMCIGSLLGVWTAAVVDAGT